MRPVLTTVLLLALAGPAAAQGDDPPLRVGTHVSPPFAMKSASGGWEGISIELWEALSQEVGRSTEWHETDLTGMVDDVASGKLDLSIAAMTVTPERELKVDFSHSYFRSNLGVAVLRRPWHGLQATLQALSSPEFLTTVGLLVGLLFVVGTLAWRAERHKNPGEFEPAARHGLFSGFWWAAVTMTTVGYGDKAPVTAVGRMIATVWMFAALIMTGVFTAQLTASIAAHRLTSSITTVGQLAHLRVGLVADSSSLGPLREIGARPIGYPDVVDGFAAMEQGDIDVFVGDVPILTWEAAAVPDIVVTDLHFQPKDYAIVLQQGSPLLEPVNRALLAYLENPAWSAVVSRYFGTGPGPR